MIENQSSSETTQAGQAPAQTAPAKPTLQRMAFSLQETAATLAVSYPTVQRLVKRGLLKSSSALRHKLIPASEIQRFLNDTLK